MEPTWFTLPWGLAAHAYGTLILLGGLVTMPGVYWDLARRGVAPERRASLLVDFYLAVTVGAFVGGRLLHVLTVPREYLADPTRLWVGDGTGFVFFGSLLAIVAGYAWLARRYQTRFSTLCDVAATWLPLGHAFGRLGCLFAGCCWGAPSEQSWGVEFPQASVAWQLESGLRQGDHTIALHPVQAYEAVGLFILAAALFITRRLRGIEAPFRQAGRYLLGYGLLRMVTEMFRGDQSRGFVTAIAWPKVAELLGLPAEQPLGVSYAQAVAVLLVVLGAIALGRRGPAPREAV